MRTLYSRLLSVGLWALGLTLCACLVYNTGWYQTFVIPKFLWFCIGVDVLFVVVIGLVLIRPSTFRYLLSPVVVCAVGFGVSLLLSTWLGIDSGRSLWGVWNRFGGVVVWWHAIVFLVCCTYCFRASPAVRQRSLQVVMVLSVAAAAYGVLEFLFGSILFSALSLPRAASFLGNPIYFANFLTIPLFLALYVSASAAKRTWAHGIMVFVLAAGIVVSVSRGAWFGVVLGLVCTLVVWWFLAQRPRFTVRLFHPVIIGIGLMACVLALLFLRVPVAGRIAQINDENTKSRLILWQIAWHGFEQHWLMGVGPENFSVVNDKLFNPTLYSYNAVWNDRPHNAYLEILVTQGVVGFLLYVCLWLSVMWRLWNEYRARTLSAAQTAALCGACVAYSVQNFFAFDTIAALIMFSFLFAFIASVQTKALAKVKDTNQTWLVGGVLVVLMVGVFTAATYVYYPIAHTADLFARALLLPPSQTKATRDLLREIIQQPFVPNRGFIVLTYADFVLKEATTPEPEHKKLLDETISYVQQAQRSQPHELQYWLKLNDLYIRKALLEGAHSAPEAEAAVRESKLLAPLRAEPIFASAILASAMGHAGDARAALDKARAIDPRSNTMIWFGVRLLVDAGNIDQAQIQARNHIREGSWPAQVKDLQWLFDWYIKGNDTQSFLQVLDLAVAHYQDDTVFLYNAAKAYIELQQTSKARPILDNLKREPGEVSPEEVDRLIGALSNEQSGRR